MVAAPRRFVALAALALLGAVTFGTTAANGRPEAPPLLVGVATEEHKWTNDGGSSFFGVMREAGLHVSRLVVSWDPSRPNEIFEREAIDRVVNKAYAHGVSISFAVTGSNPRVFADPSNRARFADFLQILAREYPQVDDVVVGNEPNVTYFWRPQFDESGKPVSPNAYVDLLARSYDALKAVNPAIRVSAGGLDARGNDDPQAPSNISISPVRFIGYVGQVYRESGRNRPLFDEVSFHPYPQSAKDSYTKSYAWPNAGIADLDRLKQAFWDAFHGTGQPTFEDGLRFNLDETGWQVAIPDGHTDGYYGREVSAVTDEATQAQIYADMIRYAACDPDVRSLLIYRLMDDANLAQWQSGLMRADGTRRPSFDTVKQTMNATGGNCTGNQRIFRHTEAVLGAAATFDAKRKPARATAFSFNVTAEENASYEGRILRVPSKAGLPKSQQAGVSADFSKAAPALNAQTGTVNARWVPLVRFPAKKLKPGWYVYAVRLTAEQNQARTSTFVSPAFRVG
jgi:hypothetical protein